MFVKWRMTTNPFTIGPDATVPEAIEVMQKRFANAEIEWTQDE